MSYQQTAYSREKNQWSVSLNIGQRNFSNLNSKSQNGKKKKERKEKEKREREREQSLQDMGQ